MCAGRPWVATGFSSMPIIDHAAPTELGWYGDGIFYKHGAPNGA